MANHAPSPWSVDKGNVLLGTEYGDEIIDAIGNRVCEVSPLSTRLANGNLLAAAPDLLAACEAALANMEHFCDSSQQDWEVRDKLAAAIKKAKGE